MARTETERISSITVNGLVSGTVTIDGTADAILTDTQFGVVYHLNVELNDFSEDSLLFIGGSMDMTQHAIFESPEGKQGLTRVVKIIYTAFLATTGSFSGTIESHVDYTITVKNFFESATVSGSGYTVVEGTTTDFVIDEAWVGVN